MAFELKLPELGEGIEEAQVLAVHVSPGDTVKQDQTVIEVETEKATAEVPTERGGKVTEVHVEQGQSIRVGQSILTIDTGSEGNGEPKPEAGPKAKEKEKAKEKPAPRPEPEAEPEDEEEPEPEAEAEAEPEEAATAAKPEGRSRRGDTPARKSPPEPQKERAPDATRGRGKIVYLEEPGQEEAADSKPGPPVAAAPSVRRLARELGVDVTEVVGTGPAGRISMDDVKSHARRLITQGARGPAPAAVPAGSPRTAPPLPDFTQWGSVERVPMSAIRRATAEAMTTAWTTVPMVTQFDRADVTELEAFRKRYADRAEQAGAKLTLTAMAVRITAAALNVFPKFNASVDVDSREVIYKMFVNVGVAVDTEHGLMVPVIRDADQKNVIEIATELGDLAERARSRKVSLDELRGGTFSISNLGGLGTTNFSPIVNWPEAAILGMGRTSTEAVFTDGAFVPRRILPLAVTYDHRLIDGADAARFLRWIAEAMENPMLIALEG